MSQKSAPQQEAPPPYAPPVYPQPGTTYVIGRDNRMYVLPPETYVIEPTVVTTRSVWGRTGVVCRCPRCNSVVETYVERSGGCGPWVWLWVILFLLIFWPLFWVPLVFGIGTGDYVHYCPVCDNAIAVVR